MIVYNQSRSACVKPGRVLESPARRVPLSAHFIWFGQQFPWVNLLALRSAALRGGFSEVILHHDSDLRGTPYFDQLTAIPSVRLQRLDLPALFEHCAPYTAGLASVFGRLVTHATRSDLVRLALLYSQGGVYLDIDTVTVRELASLCRGVNGFVGQERIVYPASVSESADLGTQLGAAARSVTRSLLRMLPRGFVAFRHVEHLFHLAVNQAVLASAPHAPFITSCIEGMIATPPDRQAVPYVLGPHLLQKTLAAYRGDDIMVHPPALFFPLAPELSAHWFRRDSGCDLRLAIGPDTRVVHWYASVRTKHVTPQVDADYVTRHAGRQLFSALALPFVQKNVPLRDRRFGSVGVSAVPAVRA